METLLPRIIVPRQDEGGGAFDPLAMFPERPRALWLEIGFGGGEHLAAQAVANPDIGIIGCELFIAGIASLLRHVEDGGISNIRVFPDDARLLLPTLPDGCFERIYVLFPDPWPKRRHAERRFIAPVMLDTLARLLKVGGELRVASDDVTYIRWVLRHGPVHPAFRWLATRPEDWRSRPSDWIPTRYETKAIREGRPPVYFRFEKVRGV